MVTWQKAEPGETRSSRVTCDPGHKPKEIKLLLVSGGVSQGSPQNEVEEELLKEAGLTKIIIKNKKPSNITILCECHTKLELG